MRPEINISNDLAGAIVALFLLFWWQSGWYRIDCALHIEKACALIADEYTKKPKP